VIDDPELWFVHPAIEVIEKHLLGGHRTLAQTEQLEHNVMHRLVEAQTRQPSPMQFGPSRTPVMAALAKQKPGELLSCPPQCPHRIEACPRQVAYRLMSRIGNPHRRQLARPVQPRQAGRIPPIGLDPVARPLRDQGGGDDNAVVPGRRQLALNSVTARPSLIAEPQLHP
jgi:hypothetical protein